MHPSSYNTMQSIINQYLDKSTNLSILDVGSFDVNGTYRPLMSPNWTYTGLDIVPGKNVDIVARTPYLWGLMQQYDAVISGQCLEHVEKPWEIILEIERSCKSGGLIVIIVPWSAGIHKHPVDCWRILPDGMKVLMSQCANLDIIRCDVSQDDCVGVARKK